MLPDPTVVANAPAIAKLLTPAAALPPDTLQARARGVMLGLAAGNLLGLPIEGSSSSEIRRFYPDGVTDIDPAERLRPMDDDLAQAVELAEALLTEGELVADFARRLVRWRRENGRGIGITTSEVIDRLEDGIPPPEAAGIVYEDFGGIAPNGGVMRCAPVALARYTDPNGLVQDSSRSCVATHYAPACQWSCIIVNAVIARYLQGGEPELTDLAQAAEADGAPTETLEWVRAVGGTVDSLFWNHRHKGHTLLCMQFGLWATRTTLNFPDALAAVVAVGGDTDTNGAVAGAVLGARYGASAIPQQWLDCIPQRERLERLADALVSLAG